MSDEHQAPVMIQFISIIGFISGLAGIVFLVPFAVTGGGIFGTAAITSLVFNLVLTVGSYGLRVMRKWGMVLFVLAVLYSLIIGILNQGFAFASFGISETIFVLEVVVLVYIFSIYKRFR